MSATGEIFWIQTEAESWSWIGTDEGAKPTHYRARGQVRTASGRLLAKCVTVDEAARMFEDGTTITAVMK
jgi:hypothetical protein